MNQKYLPSVLLIALACIWGSSFILMKRGLEVFSYEEVAALRLSLAFLALAPFGISHLLKIPRKSAFAMAVVGIVGNGIPAFLFTKAQTQVDSSLAGALNALTPLFTVVIGFIFFQMRLKLLNNIGVLIGLIGAVLLVNPFGIEGGSNWTYSLYIVVATICYATSVNVIKHFLQGYSALQVTLTGLFFAAPLPIIYLIGTGMPSKLVTVDGAWMAFMYISILAVVGTALSVVMFNQLIKITSPIFASSVTYLIPIVALVWGMLDGEELKLIEFLAMGLVLTGVYLVNKK